MRAALLRLCTVLLAALLLLAHGAVAKKGKEPQLITLHEDARIYLFKGFLSDAECDHIRALAEPRMERSGVVDVKAGGVTAIKPYRTSSGAFLERGQDPIIADVEERIARWTLLPVGNQEGLQVLRYGPVQEYRKHYDYFFDVKNIRNGGNRYATVLLYLNDVEEGGETTFPNIPAPGGDNGPEFSDCARHHLAVRPRKGSAVLFHSIKPSGELEKRSMHSSCPVMKGEKWSAPKWIHVGKFATTKGEMAMPYEARTQTTGQLRLQGKAATIVCEDKHESCRSWAASGECARNEEFMIGMLERPGECLLSCDRCDIIYSVTEAEPIPKVSRSTNLI